MGYMQTAIIEYLRGAGARSNREIHEALTRTTGLRISGTMINVALYRMARDGIVDRLRKGHYALARAGAARGLDRLLVAGALDRLEADYRAALRAELEARGWRYERGAAR